MATHQFDLALLDDDDGVGKLGSDGELASRRHDDLDPLERRADHQGSEAERLDATADVERGVSSSFAVAHSSVA